LPKDYVTISCSGAPREAFFRPEEDHSAARLDGRNFRADRWISPVRATRKSPDGPIHFVSGTKQLADDACDRHSHDDLSLAANDDDLNSNH
jgi:hypothetical protein